MTTKKKKKKKKKHTYRPWNQFMLKEYVIKNIL